MKLRRMELTATRIGPDRYEVIGETLHVVVHAPNAKVARERALRAVRSTRRLSYVLGENPLPDWAPLALAAVGGGVLGYLIYRQQVAAQALATQNAQFQAQIAGDQQELSAALYPQGTSTALV